MTPQLRLVAIGGVATLASKFYFGKDWQTALLFGFAALSAVAILTVEKENTAIA